MKFFKHSDGSEHLFPEHIPPGYQYVIRPDLTSYWRKIK